MWARIHYTLLSAPSCSAIMGSRGACTTPPQRDPPHQDDTLSRTDLEVAPRWKSRGTGSPSHAAFLETPLTAPSSSGPLFLAAGTSHRPFRRLRGRCQIFLMTLSGKNFDSCFLGPASRFVHSLSAGQRDLWLGQYVPKLGRVRRKKAPSPSQVLLGAVQAVRGTWCLTTSYLAWCYFVGNTLLANSRG